MNSFRVHTLTVKRFAQGTYDKGEFVEGSSSTLTIRASVQSPKAHDLQLLPEGRRNSQAYRLYTDTELRLSTAANPDKVVIDGEDYEVMAKSPWQNRILPHFRYVVVRMDGTPP